MEGENGATGYCNDIHTRRVRWLWYPYIPYGAVTLMIGEPGTGKSHVLVNLAAELSIPQEIETIQPEIPGIVLLQTADDADSVVKTRLQHDGAYLDRIAFCNDLNDGTLSLKELPRIQRITGRKLDAVLIDPVEAYLDADTQDIEGNMRQMIHQMDLQARLYDWAIILSTNYDSEFESASDSELGRMKEFKEIKSVLRIERRKNESQQRFIIQTRNEFAPCGEKLQFQIQERIGMHWVGAQPEITQQKTILNEGNISKTEEAVMWLKQILTFGDVPADEILQFLAKKGISKNVARRVKNETGITSIRKKKTWYWRIMPRR